MDTIDFDKFKQKAAMRDSVKASANTDGDALPPPGMQVYYPFTTVASEKSLPILTAAGIVQDEWFSIDAYTSAIRAWTLYQVRKYALISGAVSFIFGLLIGGWL